MFCVKCFWPLLPTLMLKQARRLPSLAAPRTLKENTAAHVALVPAACESEHNITHNLSPSLIPSKSLFFLSLWLPSSHILSLFFFPVMDRDDTRHKKWWENCGEASSRLILPSPHSFLVSLLLTTKVGAKHGREDGPGLFNPEGIAGRWSLLKAYKKISGMEEHLSCFKIQDGKSSAPLLTGDHERQTKTMKTTEGEKETQWDGGTRRVIWFSQTPSTTRFTSTM